MELHLQITAEDVQKAIAIHTRRRYIADDPPLNGYCLISQALIRQGYYNVHTGWHQATFRCTENGRVWERAVEVPYEITNLPTSKWSELPVPHDLCLTVLSQSVIGIVQYAPDYQ